MSLLASEVNNGGSAQSTDDEPVRGEEPTESGDKPTESGEPDDHFEEAASRD
jgi:hypothetical protein